MCVISVLRKTKLLIPLTKSQGAADRHIGCAQHDRPSTGGGGEGWPAALTKRGGIFLFGWPAFNSCIPVTRQQNYCWSGSRLGEFEETSERLTPTNVAAAWNGVGA